ncbi:alpha/beta fold hydrolase [Allosaccharopolyspora coralli]|uniref:Alpha/beta fold hydrolase n=2 Tax=Allosaccharopolyspora coralli TaxID=2665642 RepID=A0A5Q3QFD9_9PSEU|nr:alpha/beta fold hydrolase [Allosaccharopolyspora coralli]
MESSGWRSGFVECDEGRLRVLLAGERGSPVLLLSGAGVDNALLSWRHLIPALAERHRVFALDWPKQGASRPWRGHAGHERMLRCVTEVLDHFGVDAVDLVGLSQGGALTLAYAIDEPQRVSRLVAIAPAGVVSFPVGVHQLLWLTAKVALLNRTVPNWMLRSRASVRSFVRRGLVPTPPDDVDDLVDEVQAEVRAHGAASSDWQNSSIGFRRMHVDLRPRLQEISCPALFLQGDRDVAIRPKHTLAAAARVPNARLELLPGHGHWPNRQSPARVNTMIGNFLAE